MIVMGNWPPEIHRDLEQIKRIEAGKKLSKKLRSVDPSGESAQVEGSSGEVYDVTLNECSCVDFERRGLPCKHMYLLASLNGLLDDMPKYRKSASSFDACAEEEKYLNLYMAGEIPVDVYVGVCNSLKKIK